MLSIGIAYIIVDCCHGPLTPNLNRYSTDFSWSNLNVSGIIMIEICAYIFLYPWFRYFRKYNTEFSISDIFPVGKFIEDLFPFLGSGTLRKALIIIGTFNIFSVVLLFSYVFHYSYVYTTTPNSILVVARYPIPLDLLFYPLAIWVPLDFWIFFSDRFTDNGKVIKRVGYFRFLVICLMLCWVADLLYQCYDSLTQEHYRRIRMATCDKYYSPVTESIQDTLLFSNDTVFISALINLHGGDAQYKQQQLLQIEQLLSTDDKVISGCENYQEVIHKLLKNNWDDTADNDTITITCYQDRYSISQIKSLPGLSSYCLKKIYEWGDGQNGHVSISEGRGTYVDSTLQKIRLEDIVIKEKIDDVLSIVRDHILNMCREGRDSIASGWKEDNPLLYDKGYLFSIACIAQKGILFSDTMWPTSVHLLIPYEDIKEYIDMKINHIDNF